MRELTPDAQTLLNQDMGTEFMVLLEVNWTGKYVYYSDQTLEGAQAKIISLGGFDTSMMLEGSSASQELSITLDDVDNSIRGIYSSNDIHKRPARVYLLHKGQPLTDKILVFRGEIVTPIEWDATQRSVSFNVLSKLKSKQVGFSMEEGDFPNIPEEALGKAWPLVFGQVCHLPAVKVRAPRRGYLEEGEGIHDFTLRPRICQANKIQCPSQATGTTDVLSQGVGGVLSRESKHTIGPDLECVNRRFGEICILKDLLEQQTQYEHDELSIYNGISFPQNEKTTIFVDGATFTGCFTGNTFSIHSRKHPEYDDFDHQKCRDVPDMGYGTVEGVPLWQQRQDETTWSNMPRALDSQNTSCGTWQISGNGTYFKPEETQEQAFRNCDEALADTYGLVGGPKTSWEYYDEMESSDFFWAPAGSEVYMESESEILYIVSLIPGTVDGVSAFRIAPNGFRYLTEVPEEYYTVYETDYGGYTAIEIGLNKSLSLYNDQWEDQIYVSFTSDVGPNPCDTIEWLVDKYTDLSIDSSSFATVKGYLTNYPCNFYLTTRPDVYTLIQDIAYQSRCAVYVRNDIVYIKYLSREPTSERNINENDILSNSFVEFLSETEDVYTTHNIRWQKSGAAVRSDQDTERTLVLKYNVDKYETVENDWDYYTHNIYDLVLKTGTFWLIRKANSWKKVKFKLPIKHIDLDVGDCITLDVEQFSPSVKAIIESMNLNIVDYTIDVVCWTPIRSGETEPFYWAWPSQQSRHQRWPLPDDTHGGGGYAFDVTPPVGHILRGGEHRDDQLVISSGDLHPSDLDDSFPVVDCELSEYIDFDEEDPDIVAKKIAQSASRQSMENTISGGGNPGGDVKTKKRRWCESGRRIIVTHYVSKAQGQASALGGAEPGGPCGGPCNEDRPGCPSCYGDRWTTCEQCFDQGSCENLLNWYMRNSYYDISWWTPGKKAVIGARIRNGGGDNLSSGDVSQYGEYPTEGVLGAIASSEPIVTSGEVPDGIYFDPEVGDYVQEED